MGDYITPITYFKIERVFCRCLKIIVQYLVSIELSCSKLMNKSGSQVIDIVANAKFPKRFSIFMAIHKENRIKSITSLT